MSGARKRPAALREDATRCALAADPMTSTIARNSGPMNARLHAELTRKPKTASLGRRGCSVFPDEPGVQPALTVVKRRSVMVVTGTAARAQRVACRHDALRASRAHAAARVRIALSAPLLVTFLWRVREKLPAIAGRTPAALHASHEDSARSTPTHFTSRTAPSAYNETRPSSSPCPCSSRLHPTPASSSPGAPPWPRRQSCPRAPCRGGWTSAPPS